MSVEHKSDTEKGSLFSLSIARIILMVAAIPICTPVVVLVLAVMVIPLPAAGGFTSARAGTS